MIERDPVWRRRREKEIVIELALRTTLGGVFLAPDGRKFKLPSQLVESMVSSAMAETKAWMTHQVVF